MKKRIAAILFGSALALTLCACGGGDAGTTTDTSGNSAGDTTQTADTAKDEETSKDTASISTDSYDFAVKGASITKDIEGNDAIIVDCTWTNNSEETTSALAALMGQAFQDGVQLENAAVENRDGVYDGDAQWKDIRPGTTQDFQLAYELPNTTSKVEFELSVFLGGADKATQEFDPAQLS